MSSNGSDLSIEYLRVYNESGVLKYTGITFDKYLKLNPALADIITRRCKYFAREESNAMLEANKEISNLKENKR